MGAGYRNAPTCRQLAQAGTQQVLNYRRHMNRRDYFRKYRFTYGPIQNVRLCPQEHKLTWRMTIEKTGGS